MSGSADQTEHKPASSGFFIADEGAEMDVDPSVVWNAKVAAGAGAGGLVRMFLRPTKTISQTVMLLASCITCGFYATRPIIDHWHLPTDYAGAIGALTGFIGLSFAEAALKLNFRDLLSRFIGRN